MFRMDDDTVESIDLSCGVATSRETTMDTPRKLPRGCITMHTGGQRAGRTDDEASLFLFFGTSAYTSTGLYVPSALRVFGSAW